jgi:DUF4097 and DUF4098 domain-containing protein YvlB
MEKEMKKLNLVFLIIAVALSLTACKTGINESYIVGDGEMIDEGASTINGMIQVGENAAVNGGCMSVNGTIDVGANSRVKELSTVNGNINVGKGSTVRGDVHLINGNIFCEPGVKVKGSVETINGRMKFEQTLVQNDLSTYNGNLEIYDKTVIDGDIIIKERRGMDNDHHKLAIEIDNSHVKGDIINEDPDTDVTVYLYNGGKVSGKVIAARVIDKQDI